VALQSRVLKSLEASDRAVVRSVADAANSLAQAIAANEDRLWVELLQTLAQLVASGQELQREMGFYTASLLVESLGPRLGGTWPALVESVAASVRTEQSCAIRTAALSVLEKLTEVEGQPAPDLTEACEAVLASLEMQGAGAAGVSAAAELAALRAIAESESSPLNGQLAARALNVAFVALNSSSECRRQALQVLPAIARCHGGSGETCKRLLTMLETAPRDHADLPDVVEAARQVAEYSSCEEMWQPLLQCLQAAGGPDVQRCAVGWQGVATLATSCSSKLDSAVSAVQAALQRTWQHEDLHASSAALNALEAIACADGPFEVVVPVCQGLSSLQSPELLEPALLVIRQFMENATTDQAAGVLAEVVPPLLLLLTGPMDAQCHALETLTQVMQASCELYLDHCSQTAERLLPLITSPAPVGPAALEATGSLLRAVADVSVMPALWQSAGATAIAGLTSEECSRRKASLNCLTSLASVLPAAELPLAAVVAAANAALQSDDGSLAGVRKRYSVVGVFTGDMEERLAALRAAALFVAVCDDASLRVVFGMCNAVCTQVQHAHCTVRVQACRTLEQFARNLGRADVPTAQGCSGSVNAAVCALLNDPEARVVEEAVYAAEELVSQSVATPGVVAALSAAQQGSAPCGQLAVTS